MKRKTHTVYRDSDTGRFVTAATWRRSRSHGGTRYRRHSVRTGPKRGRRGKRAPIPPTVGPAVTPGLQPLERPIIPAEFLQAADDYFDSGYESDEEEEYT